ncbi:MAG: hypothetical protein KF868_22060 [Acidobacteria bacterium]|nr:hypothetical protein [Acidobacteriota bacterium]MCW5969517.1 hypothetical protein [Blastocatellales bacterium]
MRLNNNFRFMAIALGLFFVVLGAAVMVLSLFERVFFEQNWHRVLISAAVLTVAIGAVLLKAGRRRSR